MLSSPPRRTLARALVVVTAGASTAVVAGPAEARDTWSTTTSAVPSQTLVDFGETISIAVDVEVDGEDSSGPTTGTTTLYARRASATTWTAVATNDSPTLDFFEVKPRATTAYRVVFSGSRSTASQDDAYRSSTSSDVTVQVARTISHPSGGFDLRGKVRPSYRKKKIVVQVSSDEDAGYSTFRTIRTDKRGRYRLKLPRRAGTWYYLLSVKGDADYAAGSLKWRTWVSERPVSSRPIA